MFSICPSTCLGDISNTDDGLPESSYIYIYAFYRCGNLDI